MKIGPIITQLDNTAALLTATGPKITSRNRHFVIRQATVREAVEAGLIKPQYTPSSEVIADGLTKALTYAKHADFCTMVKMDMSAKPSE